MRETETERLRETETETGNGVGGGKMGVRNSVLISEVFHNI